jgi:mevalonate kinase
MKPETYYSKLLLFGEYGLMYNAMALSIPFPKFSGFLDLEIDQSHMESTAEIRKFFDHLKSGHASQKLNFEFDLKSLENDLAGNLYFNSNIPQQYGVGSSGALVAALFGKYAGPSIPESQLTPERLKADFSVLESYFHGRSSGLDPLTSYLNQALLIDSKKVIQPVQANLSQAGFSAALIDTKTTGATGPLVEHFIDQMNIPEFQKAFETQLLPANNACIQSFLDGQSAIFFEALEQLIRFQLQHFRRMIPGDFHSIISEAIADKVFIKLLGSGGGGFLIAFAESERILQKWAEMHGIDLVIIKTDQNEFPPELK